jgi:hypothetical protein
MARLIRLMPVPPWPLFSDAIMGYGRLNLKRAFALAHRKRKAVTRLAALVSRVAMRKHEPINVHKVYGRLGQRFLMATHVAVLVVHKTVQHHAQRLSIPVGLRSSAHSPVMRPAHQGHGQAGQRYLVETRVFAQLCPLDTEQRHVRVV